MRRAARAHLTAGCRELKRAYRKLALKYHPDRYDGPTEEGERKFVEVSQGAPTSAAPRNARDSPARAVGQRTRR